MPSEKMIADVLARYVKRRLTRARAAGLLDMSERQLNRELAERKLEREESEYAKRKEQAQQNRELRVAAARLVKAGKLTIAQAAARAGCSERTIYRYIT